MNAAFVFSRLQPKIESPFIVSADKLAKFSSEDDYPKVKEFPFVADGQCPRLPQDLAPEMGRVRWFTQGPVLYKGSEADRLTPPNGYGFERYMEIARGTVIFTPNEVGRYNDDKTNNHVAVFLRYGNYNKQDGIFVIDQYMGDKPKKPGIRFISRKTGAMGIVSNDARAFAVVLAIRPLSSE